MCHCVMVIDNFDACQLCGYQYVVIDNVTNEHGSWWQQSTANAVHFG